jgi:two-component system, OmpR family, sensor histidine kinase KdpD
VLAQSGSEPPANLAAATRLVGVGDAVVAVVSEPLDSVDERLLAATATELGAVIDRAVLADHAADADALGRANGLRTALLRAVSHDLRSPLSAIQASVTSLLQEDVEWPLEDQRQFLLTVSEEAGRLDRIVADLLDAGRLQADALDVRPRRAGIEEVVSAVATAFRSDATRLTFDVDEGLPDVTTDPGLLERVVENLVRNALDHSPAAAPVRVTAEVVGDRVDIRVVDRGPGIALEHRDRVFEPFRTLDDADVAGVGLGLAVARGLADAMGHELVVEDTPGGGTTMVVSVRMGT